MEISAISLNKANFRGEIIDAEVINDDWSVPEAKPDSVEISKLNDVKPTSPISFVVATIGLASLAFVAAKKTSLGTLRKINEKLPLFDNLGRTLNEKLLPIRNRKLSVEKGAKAFFDNMATRMANMFNDFGKDGISKEALGKVRSQYGAKYASNALQKITASTIGAGSAGLVVLSRHKDKNGNGIPDKAEKALSTAKEIVEVLPAVAAAVNLA